MALHSNTYAVPNNTGWVRFGPISVNFAADPANTTFPYYTLGDVELDEQQVVVDSLFVLATNVNGTPTQQVSVTLDNGTTGQNIVAATTLTASAVNPATPLTTPRLYTRLTPQANASVIYGAAAPQQLRLNIGSSYIGQATASRSTTAGVSTIVTAAAHGLVAGQVTNVLSVGSGQYNGLVTVLSVPTTTSFTYYTNGATEASTVDTAGRVGTYQATVYAFGVLRGVDVSVNQI